MWVPQHGQILEASFCWPIAVLELSRWLHVQVPMEHPSISRLHAVLQFRGSDGAAFLYDPGSAHGTVVNKQRIPAQQYVPIRCQQPPARHTSVHEAVHALMDPVSCSAARSWPCRCGV